MASLKPGDSVLIPAWVDRVEEDVVSVVIKDRRSLGVIKFREGNIVNHHDVALLDEFAAKAMQGFLSAKDGDEYPRILAACSYDVAEAMLAERKKRIGGTK